ncbi:hypothetical protein GCM10010425_33410 [Streptomyces spororaveus]|uniref:Uncharacterized protein n=1 Tax=Streptomyces spororaveus TaxID=284039 RepID=A0ABQ3TKE5_9ACTN|nr:hypothetical protein Sspor_64190 [Streptomyces spororaveus]
MKAPSGFVPGGAFASPPAPSVPTASQVNGELTGLRGAWWTARANTAAWRGSPVRIRRGPATVTGERTPRVRPGSQELSPPDTSNQGADPE